MPWLRSLELNQFRNFSRLSWQPQDRINFIIGGNGVGKSGLLEAIYYVGRGRSFRASRHQDVINHNHGNSIIRASFSEFTSFGDNNEQTSPGTGGASPEADPSPSKANITSASPPVWNAQIRLDSKGGKSALLEDKQVNSIMQLARRFPLVFAAPHNINLIEASPAQRRSFLDAIMFHHKPELGAAHKDYERCLRQRNKILLAKPSNYDALASWDMKLAELGEKIEMGRRELIPLFMKPVTDILEQFNLASAQIDYYRGWQEGISLARALQNNFERDIGRGFSSCGCHRADLIIGINQRDAGKVLSLGQQKMLSLAFFCAARLILQEKFAISVILLLDDVITQLDAANQSLLLRHLLEHENQVFITSVPDENLLKWSKKEGFTHWVVCEEQIVKNV